MDVLVKAQEIEIPKYQHRFHDDKNVQQYTIYFPNKANWSKAGNPTILQMIAYWFSGKTDITNFKIYSYNVFFFKKDEI